MTKRKRFGKAMILFVAGLALAWTPIHEYVKSGDPTVLAVMCVFLLLSLGMFAVSVMLALGIYKESDVDSTLAEMYSGITSERTDADFDPPMVDDEHRTQPNRKS